MKVNQRLKVEFICPLCDKFIRTVIDEPTHWRSEQSSKGDVETNTYELACYTCRCPLSIKITGYKKDSEDK